MISTPGKNTAGDSDHVRIVWCCPKLSPLYLAQAHGTPGAVTIAVNYRDSRGRTALHDAAEQSSVEIIKMLLKAKASVDVQDSEKETPLHKVSEKMACVEHVALLVDSIEFIVYGRRLEVLRILCNSFPEYTISNITGSLYHRQQSR